MAENGSDRGRLERFALLADIAGGAAVVISVAYLAIQISDNNRLLRSQAHYNALDQIQRPTVAMVESDTLAEVVFECYEQPREVSESQWLRCAGFYFLEMNGWEYAYYQNIDESIPPELWEGIDAGLGETMRTSAAHARLWEERREMFDVPFRSHVETYVLTNPNYRQPD